MSWLLANAGLVAQLTADHLRQSAIAIVLSFLLALPLGWLAWRFRLVRGSMLTLTGLLYTIPSLALLMIVPSVVGISVRSELNLVIALTLYGIALMVRSVADGLDSVDPEVQLAATAMSYGTLRRLVRVDFPLAGPVILAGLRVTAVSTISLATVGILAGITNLGYLFTNGFQRRIVEEVFVGIVAVIVIALVIDLLLVLAGRLVMPWARRGTRRRARVRVVAEAVS